MDLESLPPEFRAFLQQSGLEERLVAVAPLEGDLTDGEAIERFLAPVRSDLCLAHYTSWERFLWMLDNSKVYMRRIDQFGDTRDGTFPEANLHSLSVMDAQLNKHLPTRRDSEAMIASHAVYRARAYAHCWFEGWTESAEMWNQYGAGGRGVCILTRCSRLQKALNPLPIQFDLLMRGCFYRDDHEPIPGILGSLALFCKRRRFQHEREIRVVAAISEDIFNGEADEHKKMPLHTGVFFERLLTGPIMSQDDQSTVRAIMRERLPHIPVLTPRTTPDEVTRVAIGNPQVT